MTDLNISKMLKDTLTVGGRHPTHISLSIILPEPRVSRLQTPCNSKARACRNSKYGKYPAERKSTTCTDQVLRKWKNASPLVPVIRW